jgi:hypothetical protein
LAADLLVVTLRKVVLDELLDEVAQVALAKDHEVIEGLGSNRPDKSLRVAVAVRTLRRYRHGRHATRPEKIRPGPREQRISIMDQIARVAQETLHRARTAGRPGRNEKRYPSPKRSALALAETTLSGTGDLHQAFLRRFTSIKILPPQGRSCPLGPRSCPPPAKRVGTLGIAFAQIYRCF